MPKTWLKLVLFCVSFFILLIGCQSAPDVLPETTPAEVTAVSSPSAQESPTVQPTPTLAPPPVVINQTTDAQPTDTPASPTAATIVAPLPEGIIGPTNFPENVNPLTGETVDPSVLARRPLAIKISNAPAIVRPQSGLNSADLVFEHYAEGGLTRFTAVFYSKDADPVGSIRSGRISTRAWSIRSITSRPSCLIT